MNEWQFNEVMARGDEEEHGNIAKRKSRGQHVTNDVQMVSRSCLTSDNNRLATTHDCPTAIYRAAASATK